MGLSEADEKAVQMRVRKSKWGWTSLNVGNYCQVITVINAVVLSAAGLTFAQIKPAVELEGAIAKEQVSGDLKAAIAAYEKIAAENLAPRELRAKALLRLAGCYEKLGRQESRKVYEQIVREFGDQPAAGQARARLTALKQNDHPATSGLTQRRIEFQTHLDGPEDTDGRQVVYQNRATHELIYGDLAGKTKRVIFAAKSAELTFFVPSRDFSRVFIFIHPAKLEEQQTFAVVNIDGTGYREITHLDAGGWMSWVPLRSSWDNQYLLLNVQAHDGMMRVLRISTANGKVTELLSSKLGAVIGASYSPDGRYLAYEVVPPFPSVDLRIFVVPTVGGDPKEVYEEHTTVGYTQQEPPLRLLDWTSDGRFLAIANQRTGRGALDLLPIRNGRATGVPIFVKYGDFEEGMATLKGGMTYSSAKPGGVWSVYLAQLDSRSHPGEWNKLPLPLTNMLDPRPRWSSDSERIVYITSNGDIGQSGADIIRVYGVSQGDDREVGRAQGLASCTWAVQQPKLFCSDESEKTEVFSLAVDSSETTRLKTFPIRRQFWIVGASRDGRALYVNSVQNDGGVELLRWEIATGRETVLQQHARAFSVSQSPDERWFIRRFERNVEIRPVVDGEWNLLISLNPSMGAGTQINFAPDGNSIIYHEVDSKGKHSLFRLATGGAGAAERLGDFPPSESSWGSLEISPDGGKILISIGEWEDGYDYWSLDNFVPPAGVR